MEGYSINTAGILNAINPTDVELLIVPGGDITPIDKEDIWNYLRLVNKNHGLITGICAGVDVLEHAGLLDGIDSTHSTDLDVAVCGNIITARANGYVDFAIETAKKLNLFEDEADLQETIAFWREFQRVE